MLWFFRFLAQWIISLSRALGKPAGSLGAACSGGLKALCVLTREVGVLSVRPDAAYYSLVLSREWRNGFLGLL